MYQRRATIVILPNVNNPSESTVLREGSWVRTEAALCPEGKAVE